MTITLRPEIELLMQERLNSGQYHSPDELINDALQQMLGEDEDVDELNRLLDQGISDAESGRMISRDELKRQMAGWSQNQSSRS